MSGFLNVTTIPRAIFAGFVVTFVAIGLTSLFSLIVGDGGGTTPNILIYCALAGVMAVTTRESRLNNYASQEVRSPM